MSAQAAENERFRLVARRLVEMLEIRPSAGRGFKILGFPARQIAWRVPLVSYRGPTNSALPEPSRRSRS